MNGTLTFVWNNHSEKVCVIDGKLEIGHILWDGDVPVFCSTKAALSEIELYQIARLMCCWASYLKDSDMDQLCYRASYKEPVDESW